MYSGDDSRFEYIYKFVSRDKIAVGGAKANRELLDHGTLYVARFDADGRGQWLPLVHGLVPLTAFAAECTLVIDDDAMVRSAMSHLLQLWDCENWTAATIDEAIDIARLHPPTIILSDSRLPGPNTGVEITAAVCKALGREIPSLLITGDTDPQRLRQARESGSQVLHKPLAADKLYAALVKVIASR